MSVDNGSKTQEGEMSTPIVHIGPSRFCRAHIAVIAQELGLDITAVSLRTSATRDLLRPTNYDYTVMQRNYHGAYKTDTIRSIKDILVASEDRAAVVELLANPATQVVTLTVTQKGYIFDPMTDVDLATGQVNQTGVREIDEPTTTAGYIVAGLHARYIKGLDPFVVLSLDNMPNNGERLRPAILSYALTIDEGFAEWIEKNAVFPQTMVDRIVPGEEAHETFLEGINTPIDPETTIYTEPMPQPALVIQRPVNPDGNPAIDRAIAVLDQLSGTQGVVMVDNVEEYSLAKIRMLNGTHFAIGMIGRLSGYEYAHEAIRDPDIHAFVQTFLAEVSTTIPDLSDLDPQAFAEQVVERIANPYMNDTLSRLARDGIVKVVPRALDTMNDCVRAGNPHEAIDVVAAGWLKYLSRAATDPDFDIDDIKSVELGLTQQPPKFYEDAALVRSVDGLTGVLQGSPTLSADMNSARSALDNLIERARMNRINGVQIDIAVSNQTGKMPANGSGVAPGSTGDTAPARGIGIRR